MISALIVDDEKLNRLTLRKMLSLYCPQITYVYEAENIAMAKDQVLMKSPNIVFLDVEMPPHSGFDFLKSLDRIDFELIFVTAFNHYAVEAIKFSALDYIMKPVDIDELRNAVSKAMDRIQSKTKFDSDSLKVLFQESKPLETIMVNSLKESQIVVISNIVYIEADDSCAIIKLQTGERLLSSRHLMEYDKMLVANNFYRVHKSYLINMAKVEKIVRGDNIGVQMCTGETLPIARRRKDEFIQLMKRH